MQPSLTDYLLRTLWLIEWNKYWSKYPEVSPDNYYSPMGLRQLLAPTIEDIINKYKINFIKSI